MLSDSARYIMSTWRPLILAKNRHDAEWLAYDLCMEKEHWNFIDDPRRLEGRQAPTVYQLVDWRYQRPRNNWLAIEQALRAANARVVAIPDREDLMPEQWLAQVLLALDSIRQRPAAVQI